MKINVKEARSKLSSLLDQVETGDEVVILRRGKEVARLVSPKAKTDLLPSLKDFRDSIRITGKSLSNAVMYGRKKERY